MTTDGALIAASIAFLLTFALAPVLRRLALSFRHVDVPNERSSHRDPTPRNGGIAILLGIGGALVAAGAADRAIAAALAGSAALASMALVDERRALPRGARLIVQVVVAAFVVVVGGLSIARIDVPGGAIALGTLAVPVTVVWIVGLVNVYNFMDGANGLAAGQAIVAGLALAVMLGATDPAAASFAAIVAGAAAGFLPWNFPRASLFMGDTGSNTLGMAFAALTVRATGDGLPLVAAALPLAPFILDASMTILIRIRRGEAFFSTPHRLHFYQRLLDRGWSHVRVTAVWTALAAVSAVAGLVYLGAAPLGAWAVLIAVLTLHGAAALAIVRARSGRMIGSSR